MFLKEEDLAAGSDSDASDFESGVSTRARKGALPGSAKEANRPGSAHAVTPKQTFENELFEEDEADTRPSTGTAWEGQPSSNAAAKREKAVRSMNQRRQERAKTAGLAERADAWEFGGKEEAKEAKGGKDDIKEFLQQRKRSSSRKSQGDNVIQDEEQEPALEEVHDSLTVESLDAPRSGTKNEPGERVDAHVGNPRPNQIETKDVPEVLSEDLQGREVKGRMSGTSKPMTAADFDEAMDVKTFASMPGPARGCRCHIVRERGAMKMYPTYKLYMEGDTGIPGSQQGRRFLMSARKRKKSKCSNYLVSLDPNDMGRNSASYFGKLRSNLVGSEFVLYDRGSKRSEAQVDSGHSSVAPRSELGVVLYEYNLPFSKGPRKMRAIVPRVDANDTRTDFKPSRDDEQMLLKRYREMQSMEPSAREREGNFVVLKNKPPKWNERIGAWCLNFHGRVTKPSVKNFQLAPDSDAESNVLQFGKVSDDTFTMDFTWPLSALQAFLICLTSLDPKLACE